MFLERTLRGRGSFILGTGRQLHGGSFRITQVNSGRTFLYYERDPRLGFLAGQGLLAGFTGETSKGRLVHTAFQKLECIPSAGELCFVLSHVTEGDPAAGGHVHELTLTNVLFPNTLPVQMPNPVSFEVTWGNQSVAVRLTPLHG